MATTYTYGGSAEITVSGQASASADLTGTISASLTAALEFAAAGGTAPTVSGFLRGDGIAAAGDLLLAHATDPLQGMGDSGYSPGFTVAGSKLKLLMITNTDSTNSITITRKTAAGLPIFDADGDAITLAPGDVFFFYKQAGTAALTTTTNDGLTISVSGGAPTFSLIALYGP